MEGRLGSDGSEKEGLKGEQASLRGQHPASGSTPSVQDQNLQGLAAHGPAETSGKRASLPMTSADQKSCHRRRAVAPEGSKPHRCSQVSPAV